VFLGSMLYGWGLSTTSWSSMPTFRDGIEKWSRSSFWQALVNIAFSTIFCLPVIGRPITTRLIFIFITLPILPMVLLLVWEHKHIWLANAGGEGGPLCWVGGYSTLLLFGGITYDILCWSEMELANSRVFEWGIFGPEDLDIKKKKFRFLMAISWILMILGYLCSCFGIFLNFNTCSDSQPPSRGMRDIPTRQVPCENFTFFQSLPFFPPNNPATIWTMSEACPAYSFVLFNSGFSMFLYSICYYIWDILGYRTIPILTSFGINSLATYVLDNLVDNAQFQDQNGMVPRDSPAAYVLFVGFGLHLFAIWLLIKYLQVKKIFIAL